MVQLGRGTASNRRSRYSQYDIGVGTLTIITRIITRTVALARKQVTEIGPSGIANDITQDTASELLTTITLTPKISVGRSILQLTSRQSPNQRGIFSAIPNLAINNVLQANAPVFTTIRKGRFDEFQMLLRDGRASVRDHDEYGASLLQVNYSLHGIGL